MRIIKNWALISKRVSMQNKSHHLIRIIGDWVQDKILIPIR